MIDLSTVPTTELKQTLAKLPVEIERRETAEIIELRNQVVQLVTERGYTVDQVLRGKVEKGRAPRCRTS